MIFRFRSLSLVAFAAALAAWPVAAQEQRRAAIDVQSYKIDAKLDPVEQTVTAKAEVTFLPKEDRSQSAVFELHNALNLLRVTDATGQTVQNSRNMKENSVSLNFPAPLDKGKPVTITFEYGGRLSGEEESPVYGLTFASIGRETSWLLYPSRWFPISGYTTDRYTMDLKVSVPVGYKVLSSGIDTASGTDFTFKTTRPGFPGSLAVVQGEGAKHGAQGFNSTLFFRGPAKAHEKAWAEETGKVMTFLVSTFGVPPQANMTIVETGSNAPSGYSSPGLLFVSSGAASKAPSERLLANQLTRQWFGNLISPETRNQIWLANGIARYAELLYQEHVRGANAMDSEIRDLYVDAMTVTQAPVLQASRYEDYSPEFFAVTGSRGAATLHMLRGVMGDENFAKLLKSLPDQYADKSINTEQFRKTAETISGKNLQGFFIQWLESTGAPEFKIEYVVYRTKEGFRIRGKISQDMDLFSMPVDLKIETEGNPENKVVEVAGPQTDFIVETFGKPKRVVVDPLNKVLHQSTQMKVAVAIRRGEQFSEVGDYVEALREFQKALEVNRISSLGHYRVAEVFFTQGNYQSAANEFREALNGDLDPKWTEVWSHINLGKIFDLTNQRDRAQNEYTQAVRTKDNTQGAQQEAARYMKSPYQRKSTVN